MKAVVTAQAFDRKTGKPVVANPRDETIDTETNRLFEACETPMDVKKAYEAFCNDSNPASKDIVFVHRVSIITESMENEPRPPRFYSEEEIEEMMEMFDVRFENPGEKMAELWNELEANHGNAAVEVADRLFIEFFREISMDMKYNVERTFLLK